MRVVLDPGVLVAGVTTPYSPEGRVLDLIVAGDLLLLHDDAALCQWRNALSALDPALPARSVDQFLRFLVESGPSVGPGPAGRNQSGPMSLALDGCADVLIARSPSGAQAGTVRSCSAAEALALAAARDRFV